MNKYQIKKRNEYLIAEKNIKSFMQWGLDMTPKERIMQLLRMFGPLYEMIADLFSNVANAFNEVFK